jgi:hypothetical protein
MDLATVIPMRFNSAAICLFINPRTSAITSHSRGLRVPNRARRTDLSLRAVFGLARLPSLLIQDVLVAKWLGQKSTVPFMARTVIGISPCPVMK